MTLDEADELVKDTDYYRLAAGQDINPINLGDAAAFFIEGYNKAIEDMCPAEKRYLELEVR